MGVCACEEFEDNNFTLMFPRLCVPAHVGPAEQRTTVVAVSVWQCWCSSAQRWRQAVVGVVLLKRCMTVDGALLQGLVLCSHNARRTLKTLGGCIGTRLVPIQPLTSYVNMLQCCLSLKPFSLSFSHTML